MLRVFLSILIFLFFLTPVELKAQVVPVSETDESSENVNWSILPAVAYTSDYGLFGMGIFTRINYGEDVSPYLSNMRIDLSASTRNKYESMFIYERTSLLGSPIRHRTVLNLVREPGSPFFGIGNNTTFDSSDYGSGIYFYHRNELRFDFSLRKNLIRLSESTMLDGVIRFNVSVRSLKSRGADTVFEQQNPFGAEGGWVNKIGAGLISDSRNSEFFPTRGYRYEIGVNLSDDLLGSDFSFTEYFTDFRHYFSPVNNVVLAHRAALRHTSGEVPFWQLPILGNERGLRGYALDRFIGDSSVLQILELRTWLFSFLDDNIKLGSHVFWDSGRVFSEFDSNGFFESWNHTYGIGGTISAISPDLILRFEIAFSDEDHRFYAGMGYIF